MKDSVTSLTRLGVMVLALLSEGDMHPYEMIRLMRRRRDDRFFAITPGTLYHTVARLERQGLLAEAGVDREGNRPERTTYALTEAGRAAAAEWVRRELPRADRPVEFRVALAEAHNLDRDEVIALLSERRDTMDAERSHHADRLAAAAERETPPQFLVEVVRQEALLRAELAWLETLIADLGDQRFAWGAPTEPTARYIAERQAARG